MQHSKGHGKKKIKLVMGVLVFALGTIMTSSISEALLKEEDYPPVNEASIEEATLVIGTHLIHISALTDALNTIALDSVMESGQDRRYYKSELAAGAWYDITDASSLEDIAARGIRVDKQVIQSLILTHHTKSDGVTYDLQTNGGINIFDIKDPYDLEKLAELEPIKLQYDLISEKKTKTKSDEFDLLNVKKLFELNVKNEVTEEADKKLGALQSLYVTLVKEEQARDKIDIVTKVMEKIDATRRAEVMRQLFDPQVPDFIKLINGIEVVKEENGDEKEEEKLEIPEEYVTNTDLAGSASSSLDLIQVSLNAYEANQLEEGSTLLGKVEYEIIMSLINGAEGNKTLSLEAITKLMHLGNIKEGNCVDIIEEKAFLDSDLIGKAEAGYIEVISAGAKQEYLDAKANGMSQTQLRQILETQKSQMGTKQLELQFMIDAQVQRMDTLAAQEYTSGRIAGVSEMQSKIAGDDFKSYAKESTEDYKRWLQGKLQELIAEGGGSKMDGLVGEKDELLQKLLEAAESGDLVGKREAEALIALKDEEIKETEGELSDILNDPQSSEEDKAKAQAQFSEGSSASAIEALKGQIGRSIANRDYGSLQKEIEGLGSLASDNPKAAADALQGVYKDLTTQKYLGDGTQNGGEDKVQELLDGIENTILENAGLLAPGGGTGNGTGNGAGSGTGTGNGLLSMRQIYDLLERMLGGKFDSLSSKEKAGALIAINWYGQQMKSTDIMNQASQMAEKLNLENNPYLYEKLKNEEDEYIQTKTIASILSYHYVFNDSNTQVTMQKNTRYYKFNAFSAIVEKNNKETVELEAETKLQGTVYLWEADAVKLFACEAEYIERSAYGVAATKDMLETAREILDALMEAGGK